MLRTLILSVLFSLSVGICRPQDANYWSSNYGTGGFFTPGAVIARNNDSGVLFFNPALLADSKKNAVTVSGTIYQWEIFRIKNGVGDGLHLKGGGSSVNPLIASNSYVLNRKKKNPVTLFYALINRAVIDFQASQRKDTKFNVLDDSYSPGTEYYIGQYNLQNKVNETGFVASSGFKLSQRVAIGVTIEGEIRKQFFKEDFNSRALENSGTDTLFPPLVNVSQYYQNSNRNIGARVKMGLTYSASAAHHFGLLITSPLIPVSGKATIVSDLIVNNLTIDGIEFRLLANTRQEKLKSKWKMPLSTAIGYNYHHKKGQVYFAAEYFTGVKEYNVVTPRAEIFVRPDTAGSSGTPALLRMKDARKAVLNAAAGASLFLKPTVTGYISFRTDFSYADRGLFKDDEGQVVNTSCWNNYHCQVGANIIRKKFSLRTGFLFTYGNTNGFRQDVNFDNPNESNFLLGELSNTKASHFLAGVMVSYIHNL